MFGRCARGHEVDASGQCRACGLIEALKPHTTAHLMHLIRLHAEVWSVAMSEAEVAAAAREMLGSTHGPAMTAIGTPASEPVRSRRIAADDLEGLTVGDVQIDRRLGAGGMGVVYAGRYREHAVAVKVLHHVNQRSLERLTHEATAMRQLPIPEFVRVVDLVVHDGIHLLVMDLASGRPLRDLMKAPWRMRAALDLMIPIIDAVGRAHALGVMHTDLKPENILCEPNYAFRILDLGLAIINQRDSEGGITMEGVVAGTPMYMAPEQTRGLRLDVRADVYALGSMLYELLTGTNPMLVAGHTHDINEIFQRKQQPVAPPATLISEIPRGLDRICLTALAIDREQRYPSARALAEALRSLVTS